MTNGRVCIVDDDAEVRRALERLLRGADFDVVMFESADDLLAHWPVEGVRCLILDVAMPGLDGLALQRRLAEVGARTPIVFLTGHGDIPMSVSAIKGGAIDFLTKPVRRDALLVSVRAAIETARSQERAAVAIEGLQARYALLTPREREVMAHVIAGRANKVIAADLGTGEQTVKVHRGRVMQKLEADSVADLVRIAQQLGVEPAD